MTDDQRQRIEAAVREACQTIWINDFSTRWAKEHVIPKLDKPFLTAITPVIDAMLSEREANYQHLMKGFQRLFSKECEELTEQLAARDSRIADMERAIQSAINALHTSTGNAAPTPLLKLVAAQNILTAALNGEPNDG